MSELGRILKEARTSAGLSLAGMAKRTGYSRSHIGNVENGTRQATPDVIRAYEKALGEDLDRRSLLLGTLGILAAGPADQTATAIAHEITNGRSNLLMELQTSHATDKGVAALVGQDTAALASLSKWSSRGKPVLRVNAAGILAKVPSPAIGSEAVAVLRSDGDVRDLYLTAVLSRVLGVPWDAAANLATSGGLSDVQVSRLAAELSNNYDAGARWCATVALYRDREADMGAVNASLFAALRTEASSENIRAIGAALAGISPLNI
ncbi:helix-turn-helix transcriptional regulator [Actinoplanes oblitus]|uniref:Helix-turn-helix transcriptional regulator n=1 Tax=Actinoplanes oblitus TaxID=3040509 RepID=A0ABY8W8S6_9ACTN|nr:helix-turn-helix transcriptional regulator [Actinoplanes oblitus]WIM94264.1 helix-turn-helix transcriptional regulator [Actinoplanes oblitus]